MADVIEPDVHKDNRRAAPRRPLLKNLTSEDLDVGLIDNLIDFDIRFDQLL